MYSIQNICDGLITMPEDGTGGRQPIWGIRWVLWEWAAGPEFVRLEGVELERQRCVWSDPSRPPHSLKHRAVWCGQIIHCKVTNYYYLTCGIMIFNWLYVYMNNQFYVLSILSNNLYLHFFMVRSRKLINVINVCNYEQISSDPSDLQNLRSIFPTHLTSKDRHDNCYHVAMLIYVTRICGIIFRHLWF